MTKTACMMTELLVPIEGIDATKAIVVTQESKIIGVVSTAALAGVKTVRLTFTRDGDNASFSPVQAQALEAFGDFSDGYKSDDELG